MAIDVFHIQLEKSNSLFEWQFQKKRTSMSKKRIRKNLWEKRTYFSIVQSYSLAKSYFVWLSKE